MAQLLEGFFNPTYFNTFQDSAKAYYFPEKMDWGSRGESGFTKPEASLQFGVEVAWYFFFQAVEMAMLCPRGSDLCASQRVPIEISGVQFSVK